MRALKFVILSTTCLFSEIQWSLNYCLAESSPQVIRRLPSPPQLKINFKKIQQAKDAQVFYKSGNVTLSSLPNIEDKPMKSLLEIPEPHFTQVREFSNGEIKFFQALIFLEVRKNFHLAFGLFNEVMNEDPGLKLEASYNLALASLELKLFNEFRFQMTQLLNNKKITPDLQEKVIQSLVQNSQPGDLELVALIDKDLDKFSITTNGQDVYLINKSRYYANKGNLSLSIETLEAIPDSSVYFEKAQFLKSIFLYRSGFLDEGREHLKKLVDRIDKDKSNDHNIDSLIHFTMARLFFQSSQYKEAYLEYLKIDKKHPDWPQAMIEAAWSQILSEDFEGAAGNMYSLHTDFFKYAFAPESYIVRTVGYLNLCQFGDSAKVIQNLKKKYTPLKNILLNYQKEQTQPLAYYDTVRDFLKMKDDQKGGDARKGPKYIDGIPRTFIYELARHPSFIDKQKDINDISDEIQAWSESSSEGIKIERNLIKQLSEAQDKKVKSQNLEKIDIESIKMQLEIVKRARNSVKALRSESLSRLESEKLKLKEQASHSLKVRFNEMLSLLNKTLDQSDLLVYEIYSGAGEHLRFQTTGGKTSDKQRVALTPEEMKQLNWDFKGEIWEDELGNFRSSLKNVCAQEVKENL